MDMIGPVLLMAAHVVIAVHHVIEVFQHLGGIR